MKNFHLHLQKESAVFRVTNPIRVLSPFLHKHRKEGKNNLNIIQQHCLYMLWDQNNSRLDKVDKLPFLTSSTSNKWVLVWTWKEVYIITVLTEAKHKDQEVSNTVNNSSCPIFCTPIWYWFKCNKWCLKRVFFNKQDSRRKKCVCRRQAAWITHHDRVHIKITKGAHMGKHERHDSQEILHFSLRGGAHPSLHEHVVRCWWRRHAKAAVGVMGKIRILAVSAATAAVI